MAVSSGILPARKDALNRLETALRKFPPLLERTFISCGDEEKVLEGNFSEFRVMQWNILADALSSSSPTENFIKCPARALEWSNRKLRSLQEILTYDPDVIALEEIDHFEDYFLPSLRELGYEGLFAPKRDSPCLKFPNNSGPDGCALFYDFDRFSVVNHTDIALKDSDGNLTSQVALIVNLLDKVQGRTLCCGVTHFKAKEEYRDLRFSQGNEVLKCIFESLGDDKTVLICGDFNAEPSEPVCQLMEENHCVCMKNSYVSATGENPEFTTWKFRPGDREVKHTIDYIWHSPNLNVTGCVKVPESDIVPENLLPCLEYPSDHLSLVFDFRWG
ncbi:nocturnin-like [Montipora foliosa]|uniref:nocturnin-like n=1 Tax=Montipora foliosa TaxID=591990 RepID=UPI0035F19D9C